MWLYACSITLPQINHWDQKRSLVRPYGDPSRLTSSAKRKSRATTPGHEAAGCFSAAPPHGTAGWGNRKPSADNWPGWVTFGLQHEEICKAKSIGGSAQEQNPGCTGKSRAVEQFVAFPSCGGASHSAAMEGSLQLVHSVH